MKIDNDTKPYSSWLVHKWTICCLGVVFTFATAYKLSLLSAFTLLIIFVCLLALLWSRYSIHKICISAQTSASRVFAGENLIIKYSLKNLKLLPLIWANWVQPLSPKQVIVPCDDEEWLCVEELDNKKDYYYSKQLSWILWHHEANWESTWKAERRGIYTCNSVLLSSGDGFGLAAIQKELSLPEKVKVIIYPALVPVDIHILLRQPWGTDAGNFGFIEDKTLIKGTRNFQSGDSWKHINWRLAALQRPLQVNIFDKVKYPSMHFIVSIRSFLRSSDPSRDFEDALSILASVMVELSSKNIALGISTPTQEDYGISHLTPENGEEHLLEILENLAHLSYEKCGNIFVEMEELQLYDTLEQVYIVTYDSKYINDNNSIIQSLDGKLKAVLNYCNGEDKPSNAVFGFNFDIIPMKALKRR